MNPGCDEQFESAGFVGIQSRGLVELLSARRDSGFGFPALTGLRISRLKNECCFR
jgi:hypothetical protein